MRQARPIKATALLAALALGACTVGPDYVRPGDPVGRAAPLVDGPAVAGSPAAAALDAAPTPDAWWTLYGDPALTGYVQAALTANTDLRQAAANLDLARAFLSEARVARLPSAAIAASATRNRESSAQIGETAPGAVTQGATYDLYDAGVSASYEVDLFGRVRRLVEAGRADRDAAEAARDLTATAVASATVRAYVEACSSAERLAVAKHVLGIQDDTVRLTRLLLTEGRDGRLDLVRAAALADQTRATLPPLEAERSDALARLSVLMGRTPFEGVDAARACTATPALSAPLPVGDGVQLIRRRADVREAERRLHAETARIGVATAALYPTVSLGGSLGTTALSTRTIGDDGALRYSAGPLLSWSFPNVGVARARIRQARARSAAALAQFDGTVLTALQEAQSALAAYVRERDRSAALSSARDNAADATAISRARFREGADDFLVALDAERTLGEAELALASSRAAAADDQVQVFRVLGGGWLGARAIIRNPSIKSRVAQPVANN